MAKAAKSSKPAAAKEDGRGHPILVRLQPVDLQVLDAWIKRQLDGHALSRPEALRRLARTALLLELERVPA